MIVVTGTTGKMGKAIADLFGDCFRIDKHNCDLTNESEVRSIVGEMKAPVKVLVNCAGVSLTDTYGDMDVWDRTFAVNVRAVYYLSSLVKDLMTEGGSIVNITSMNTQVATPMTPAYAASKGALMVLTKAMAYDWAHLGIRVNNIMPGMTHTNMTHYNWNIPEQRKLREDKTLLGRYAEPEEIAKVVKWVSESSYMTGSDIIVDGGWGIKGR